MLAESVLGTAIGPVLQPVYYRYILVSYPWTRYAILGVLPPLLLGLTLAYMAEGVLGLFSAKRRASPVLTRPFGLSLFLSVFLQIEAAKLARAFEFPHGIAVAAAAGLALLLTILRVRGAVTRHTVATSSPRSRTRASTPRHRPITRTDWQQPTSRPAARPLRVVSRPGHR